MRIGSAELGESFSLFSVLSSANITKIQAACQALREALSAVASSSRVLDNGPLACHYRITVCVCVLFNVGFSL